MNGPLSIQGAGQVAAHVQGTAPRQQAPEQMPVQPPRRSFFAAVRAWLGGGGEAGRPSASGDGASGVARLRPPTTGRFSAFFGRYQGVSDAQIKAARDAHGAFRDGKRTSVSDYLPDSVRHRLQQVASRSPDQIFDAVCSLWNDGGGPKAHELQTAVESVLKAQDQGFTLLALESALRKTNRWQTNAQVSARAQAAYAALVGCAHARSAGQVEGLGRQLAALEAGAGRTDSLGERSRHLASLRAEIASLPTGAGQALSVRCEQVAAGLRGELLQAIRTQADSCQSLRLDAPDKERASRQAGLDALRQAFDTCPGWPESEHAEGARRLAAAQDDLATWQQGQATLRFYDGLRDRDPSSGHERAPCKCIAQLLRDGTVAEYRQRQGQIDGLCAKAPADQHLALLAALGVGIRGADGRVQVTLLDDLSAGQRQAVDPVFAGAEWDELAGALKRDGLAQREQRALAGAGDDVSRQKLAEQFRRERFSTERQQQLRVLNGEINRLIAAGGPRGPSLLGEGGRMAEASEAAIAAIRQSPRGLEQDADLLLLNWIYYSSLDAQTLEVDQDKAARLWAAFGTGREVPAFAEVKKQLAQGFRSLGDAARADRMLQELAGKLPASKTLAAASQAQDARVAARGIARDLLERMPGSGAVDLADEPQVEARIRAALEQAKREAADEQSALPRKAAERDDLFDQLAGQKWKLERDADVRHGEQLRVLVDCLALVEQIEAAKAAGLASAGALTRELMARLPQLKGFDPQQRQFGTGVDPSYGTLKTVLKDKHRLQAWLDACREVKQLSSAGQDNGPKARSLSASMEAATRVAILQEAIAAGPSFSTSPKDDPQGPAKAVLKRLARMGLSAGADQPAAVRQHLGAVLGKMQQKDRGLPRLCARFDPADAKAKGFLQPAVPGHPGDAGAQGVVGRMRGYMDAEAAKLRAQNRRAVEERFKALEVGQSFALEVGQASQLSGGYSLVPGVGISGEGRGERASGIRVSLSAAGYEISVMDTRAAGLVGVLSLLGETVSARLGRTQSQGEGFLFTCTDPGDALRLIEGVAGGATLGTGQLASVKVQALRTQARETSAQLQAQAALTLPGDQELFKLEAQLAAARGERIEVRRSPFVERQRRTATRTVLASGGVSVLNGKWSAEAERGYEMSVTRDLTRRGALLTGPQTLAIRARLVNDDARASLQRVMPHLKEEAARAELDHYLAQIERLQGQGGEAATTTEVELECAMTTQAAQKANGWYRRAEAAPGTPDAMHAMEEAERILHYPESYAFGSVHLLRRSDAEVVQGRTDYLKSVARVSGEERLALQGPSGGSSQPTSLPRSYGALVGSAPAAELPGTRLRAAAAVAA